MELFHWKKEAFCSEYHRYFPGGDNRFAIKMPLFSPKASIGTVCQCQNDQCLIAKDGGCSHRATFTETDEYNSIIIGTITPELRSDSNFKYAFET